MKTTTIGIDLAKQVFVVHGGDARGKAALTKQLKRDQVLMFSSNLGPCLIGPEGRRCAHSCPPSADRCWHAAEWGLATEPGTHDWRLRRNSRCGQRRKLCEAYSSARRRETAYWQAFAADLPFHFP